MPLPEERRYTAADFYSFFSEESNSEIHELINGVIYDMAPPSILHQQISMGVSAEIYGFIRKNKGKCRVFSAPTDVKLNDETVVVPDIFAACDPELFDSRRYNGAPDWIIEIVSANRAHDLVRKLSLYQAAGVREYWIIDPKYERTVVYYFDRDEYPVIYPFDRPVPVNIYDGNFSINISEIL